MRRMVFLIVLLALSPLSAFGASPYGLTDLLARSDIQRNERLVSHPVSIWRLGFPWGDGWNGVPSDRWHSSDAFRFTFRDEFANGLLYYLRARGFKIDSSPEAMEMSITMDQFEGRERTDNTDNDSGGLRGTFTLLHNGRILAKKELFESLSYQNQERECDAFAKEFGLKNVDFPTVLFYRLSVSFFASIEAAVLESRLSTPQESVSDEPSP